MKNLLLIFICAAFLACGNVKRAEIQSPAPDLAQSSPTGTTLKPVAISLELNAKQQKDLDAALPPQVREILEKSQKFSVLASTVRPGSEPDGIFRPEVVSEISDDRTKKALLEAFYHDVSTDPVPGSCYDPHCGMKAEYKGQTVEIDICFDCSRIVVRSPFGEFTGGLTQEDVRSSDILMRLVTGHGTKIQK